MNLSIHRVKSITQKTETIENENGPFKLRTYIFETEKGKILKIDAFLIDGWINQEK